MPDRPNTLDQTSDLPNPRPENPDLASAPVEPGGGPSTGRQVETSVRSQAPDGSSTAALIPDTARDDLSATGGYVSADELPAPIVIPGYEILGLLGRGGMGVVYKARQVGLDRIVALKMILAGPHASPAVLSRFQSEAHAVAKLQHPNIVQIFEVGRAAGMPFLSLEFVDGGSLSAQVAHEPQSPEYAARTVETLARAVQYAHERGIIHRDLKPANVLLTQDGMPKITDFGLAKKIEGDSGQTQAGAVLGTPSYMAPEQAIGDLENIGPKSDVYALGAVLYDLLTGRPPFTGSTVLDTLEMVRSREPVPPSQLAGKLPKDVETICLKCLHKDPARRYATASDLADDLRRFLDGRPIVARPVSVVERGWRWAKRNPKVAGLVSTVAVLLVAIAAVTSVMSYRLNIKKKEAEEAAYNESVAKNNLIEEQRAKESAHSTTMQTIRTVLLPVDGLMRDHPKFASVRLAVFAAILQHLDEIRAQGSKNSLEDRTEAGAHARIGDIYLKGGRIQDSHESLSKALPLLKAKVDESPKDPVALHNLAAIVNQIADVEWRIGNGQKARDMYVEALGLRRSRVAAVEALLKQGSPGAGQADLVDARQAVAMQHGFIAFADLRLGYHAKAIENYLESDREFANLPRPRAGSLTVRRMRAEVQGRLGDARLRSGQPDAANEHYRKALAERLELLRLTPRPANIVAELKSEIAMSRLSLGDFLLAARKDIPAAFGEYAKAFEQFDGLIQAGSESLELLRRMAATHYRIGVCVRDLPLPSLVRQMVATRSFAECLRIRTERAAIDRSDTQSQVELMLALARAGRTSEAEKLADSLRAQTGTDRQVMLQVTCGFAVAGQGDDETAIRCRDKAFQALDILIENGWKDRALLELDPDLAALKTDKRFAERLDRLPH